MFVCWGTISCGSETFYCAFICRGVLQDGNCIPNDFDLFVLSGFKNWNGGSDKRSFPENFNWGDVVVFYAAANLWESLYHWTHLRFWFFIDVSFYDQHTSFVIATCRKLYIFRGKSCSACEVILFWFLANFGWCYCFFCRKTERNVIIMSFLFWVLLTHRPCLILHYFCNGRKRNHRLIGFDFTFLRVALSSSSELEVPYKDLVTAF
ncbi:hypothetical protein KFK09_011739 [Dendrobium nobile]|uniref:Uncharacterized protein n=1 Tax=Dendrobium nobile TaxID=94219 RepID=A0A8T3BDR7_DENNO|nr:hypothetical protein KFK09_011739 [Dendrobium nobile]